MTEPSKPAREPGSKIRYAVVGAGNIAQGAVLPAFANATENSELVALLTSDDEKRTLLAQKYHLAHTGSYDDLERVLQESRADAVYITLPNDMHLAFTERCARAGVHVLCEKPMAMTSSDCEAMSRVCADHHVKLMIAYRLHFEEATLRAVELARSGQLGEVRLFSSVFSHVVRDDDVRQKGHNGGGALYDIGIYCLNAARMLFRDEPEEVFAWSSTARTAAADAVDETTGAMLRFSGGRIAQLLVSQGASDVSSYRIVGTEGDLHVEPAFEYVGDLKHAVTHNGKTSERTFPQRDQFAPELIALSRCILDDEEPEASGEEGLADVRVLEALAKSAETGRPVALAAFKRSRRPDMSQEMHKPAVPKQELIHAPPPSR